MKKILKTFIFLAIMMGIFLIPKVEATEINFEQKVKDMKDYLAPDSIYIYMKQENKEWETTLTDGNPNSNANLPTLYTGISFLENKDIDLFIITPHTYGDKFDIYDMDIRLDIGSAKVEQVGEVKEQYGEEGYVAFLYTIKVTDVENFGQEIDVNCATEMEYNGQDIDFKLPLFVHIEVASTDYYSTKHEIDVEQIITDWDFRNKFKNNVEGQFKNNIWVYMKQGDVIWNYNFYEANTGMSDFNSERMTEDKGYNTSGVKFKTDQDIEVLVITHMTSDEVKQIRASSSNKYSSQDVETPVIGGGLKNGDVAEADIILRRVDYGNDFLVVHYKIKLNKGAGGNENRVLINLRLTNYYWENETPPESISISNILDVNFILPISIFVNNDYDDRYYEKEHLINVEEIIKEKGLAEKFKNPGVNDSGAIWVCIKQGNDKYWEYYFSKDKTGNSDFNSAGTINDQGYATEDVVFRANEDIEILLVTHTVNFNNEPKGEIQNTDADVSNSMLLKVFKDSDNKYMAYHYQVMLKDFDSKNSTAKFRINGNNQNDVNFSLPITVYLYDKEKNQINLWQEVFNNSSKLEDIGTHNPSDTKYNYGPDSYGSYNRTTGDTWTSNKKYVNDIYILIKQDNKTYSKLLSSTAKESFLWGEHDIQQSLNGASPSIVPKTQSINIELDTTLNEIPETFNMNEKVEMMIMFRPEEFSGYSEWNKKQDQSIEFSEGFNGFSVWAKSIHVGFIWTEIELKNVKTKVSMVIRCTIENEELNKRISRSENYKSSTRWNLNVTLSAKDPTTSIVKEGKEKVKEEKDTILWLTQGDKEYSLPLSYEEYSEFGNETYDGKVKKIYVTETFDLSKTINFYSMSKGGGIGPITVAAYVGNVTWYTNNVPYVTTHDEYSLRKQTIDFWKEAMEDNEKAFILVKINDSGTIYECRLVLEHKLTEEEIQEEYAKEEEALYKLTGIKYSEVSADLDKNLGEGELKLIVGDNVVNETATLKGLTSVDLPKDNRVRAWPDNTIGVFLYYKDKALVSGKFKEIIIIEEATGNKLATLTKDNLKADTEIVKASIEKEEFVKNVGSSMDAVKSLMTFNFSKSGTYTIKVIMETKKGSTTTLTTINIKLVISETANSSQELEGILGSGKNWLDTGLSGANKTLDTNKLMDLSNQLYNMFIIIAIAVAIIVGGILGIRYMTAGIDQKVQVKETLIPYAISCIVVFGAAGIWRLIVLLVQQI